VAEKFSQSEKQVMRVGYNQKFNSLIAVATLGTMYLTYQSFLSQEVASKSLLSAKASSISAQ